MTNKQAGFTLIELVIVIVILGILAATALPKFADLGGSAKHAKISAALGAMKTAGAIVRSQVLVSGVENGTITLDGTNITVANGYVNGATIALAAGIDVSDFDNNIVVGTAAIALYEGTCSIVYLDATMSALPEYQGVLGATNGTC